MAKQVITNLAELQASIKQVQELQKKVDNGCKKLVKLLADQGAEIARLEFQSATYDGDNDVQVQAEYVDDHTAKVKAYGQAVLFIEFGSGIVYPRTNPEDMYTARSYSLSPEGKNAIKRDGRWYYNDSESSAHMTYGNPSNNCMYKTKEGLKRDLGKLVKECFK